MVSLKQAALDEDEGRAVVTVAEDQQSLAIGRGGQNVRLAAKLTGWNIDILSASTGTEVAEAEAAGEEDPAEAAGLMPTESIEIIENAAPEVTVLTAEEELVELPASDETVAEASEDRDKAKDE